MPQQFGFGSHGIIVSRAPAATPTVFADIANLMTIGLPGLNRNEFEAAHQNQNIDAYVISTLLRRKAVTLGLDFLPADASHDHLTGLYKALIDNSFDGYKFTHAASGLLWVASGQVTACEPKTPEDNKLQLDVTLRFSGVMSMNGVTIGS